MGEGAQRGETAQGAAKVERLPGLALSSGGCGKTTPQDPVFSLVPSLDALVTGCMLEVKPEGAKQERK